MEIQRRDFLKETAVGAALAAVFGHRLGASPLRPLLEKQGIKIGGCDWSLEKEGNPEAFGVAKEAGLDGVEVSCGKGKEKLPISDGERQAKVLAESKKHGLAVPSTCLEVLHRDGLKDHADAPKWVKEAIAATKNLGAKVILLPFFGKQSINKRSEQEAVAERLKAVAPQAESAGIVLGLENTISAKDNAWILDQVKSPAVKVYYDVGNSFNNKFEIYNEVAWLGKERVCQIHLKDKAYLGQGAIDFPKFLESVLKSGFGGWMMLETNVQKTVKEDFAANAAFVRKTLAEKSKE